MGGSDVSFGGRLMLAAIVLLILTLLFIIFLSLYARWLWGRNATASSARTLSLRRIVFGGDGDSALAPRGLEHSTIRSLPVLLFRRADFKGGLECAVCLCELSDGETARLLPKCNHGFHLDCIDMWFRSHSTCPLCRDNVSPDPDKDEIRAPEQTLEDGLLLETPNFPTNILFWGSREGSLGSSSSSSLFSRLERNGMAVIDVPLQNREGLVKSPASSSIRFSQEELKSPAAATHLRSLKRLLSREKRAAAPSSLKTADVELGGITAHVSAKAFPSPDS